MQNGRKRRFPIRETIDILKCGDVVSVYFIGKRLKLLLVGIFAASVKNTRFVFAELVQKFGFSDAPSAIQNDEFRMIGRISVVQKL